MTGTEPETCAVCKGTWGEPNSMPDIGKDANWSTWQVCPADCHDEAKWAELGELDALAWGISSGHGHPELQRAIDGATETFRTRIAELEKAFGKIINHESFGNNSIYYRSIARAALAREEKP